MLQKVNFTGRVDLPMDSLDAYIEKQGSRFILHLEWDFGRFNFDSKSELWLEIRRAGTYEYRREYLSNFKKGKNVASVDVSNMTDPMNLRLRLKVVFDKEGKRLLVGNLDNFVPRVPEDKNMQRGFLKIIKDDSLEIPWRLKFDYGEPILVISGKRNTYTFLKEDSRFFIPAILPEVVRQVAIWAFGDRNRENQEVFDKWENFLRKLGAAAELFDQQDFIDQEADESLIGQIEENATLCANEFSRRHQIINVINTLAEAQSGESDV